MSKQGFFILLIVGLFSVGATHAQTTYYVKTGGSDALDGLTWGNAFATLQKAIESVSSGNEIWVAAGTYYPSAHPRDITESPTLTDRDFTFHLVDGVAIYGGFAGSETLLSQRDTAANPTILSGDIGVIDDTSDNTYHVLLSVNDTATTIVDGFTITKGNADVGTLITIEGLIVGRSNGGGFANVRSDLSLSNLVINANKATFGAGMNNFDNASPELTNVLFVNNIASVFGGGMLNIDNCTVTLNNTTFFQNSADQGGAIRNDATTNPTATILNNTVFYGNTGITTNPDIFNTSGTISGSNTYLEQDPIDFGNPSGFTILSGDPFTDSSDPDGADNIIATEDDGLVPIGGNEIVNAGDNAQNSETYDITGTTTRIIDTTIDVGAYENSCGLYTSNIIYVDINATGTNSGTDWTNAYTCLQDAITTANSCSGSQIWVAAGTYYPSSYPRNITGSPTLTDRDFTFHLVDGAAIYGGFAGTETLLSQRNITTNLTILSGDIGTIDDTVDNTYHVMLSLNDGATTIVDGFTITEGNANGTDNINIETNNVNQEYGGGLYNGFISSPSLYNLIIENNLSSKHGGGIYNFSGSNPELVNVILKNNVANNKGGGMYNRLDSNASLTNVVLANNTASDGGGVFSVNSNLDLTNVLVIGNTATNNGGGIYNKSSDPSLSNVSIFDNSAASGDGIYNEDNGSSSIPVIYNSVFYGNNGDDIFNEAGSAVSGTNNYTEQAPSSYGSPAGFTQLAGDPFTDSSDPDGADNIYATIDDGLVPVAGNEIINIGDNAQNPENRDITGVITRIQDGTIDVGAYEYVAIGVCGSYPGDLIYVDTDASGSNDGTDWTNAFTSLESAVITANTCGVTQIWVAGGTYYPSAYPRDIDGSPTLTDRDFTFHLVAGVDLYGGFVGTETLLSERDIIANPTILSGDIGTIDNTSDNTYHVLLSVNDGTSTVVDGFTVTKGNADGAGGINVESQSVSRASGGGIFNVNSQPVLRNDILLTNAANTGGGIYARAGSKPRLFNVIISGNSSTGNGGGSYNANSNSRYTNVVIEGNTSSNKGGGIFSTSSNPLLNTVSVVNNSAANGDGIYNNNSAKPTINNGVFYSNNGDDIFNNGTSLVLGTNTYTEESPGTYGSPGNYTQLSGNPFVNSSDPDGADNIWATTDDGLVPAVGNEIINTGDNSKNSESYDITGTITRVVGGTIDPGAYEQSQSFVDFDGTDDHIDLGDEVAFEFGGGFSLEAWVLQETTVSSGTIISKCNLKTGSERGYKLTINNGIANLKWYNSSNTLITNISSPYAISNNKWYHIAATYNGTTAKLYIDGVEVTSDTPTEAPGYGTEKLNIGATYNSDTPNTPEHFFNGLIDEVRLWNVALSAQQLREMMNQEIDINGSLVKGETISSDISSGLLWASLQGYYNMNSDDATDTSSYLRHGSPRNMSTSQLQTAPLPYTTKADGVWTDTTASTPWTLGDTAWGQPNGVGIDGITPIDWNIVQISHNISSGLKDITVLALVSDTTTKKLTIANPGETLDHTNSGQELRVTHYLKLDGDIDLVGESQLIQDQGSILDVTSGGKLERDQQGTADMYTYNYWSSPVGISNTNSNNNSYTLQDIMKDGTSDINFLTSGYNGAASSPISIADYWVWKYISGNWQHVRSTGTLLTAEGFTMKGPGTGNISDDQNYVFIGKPNNGDINIAVTTGNSYLVGNPYPSAMDAHLFILDNGALIAEEGATTGTIYFWEHWGGGSHASADYQGGYGTYTLAGGAPAASQGSNHPEVGTGGTPLKTPGRYIPVGQGFFVVAETNGSVNFNNGQRIFTNEGASSTFMRASSTGEIKKEGETEEDPRMKFRIGFYSVNTIHRQLLLTIDEFATPGIDWGFDGELIDPQIDDFYWMLEDVKFNIQSTDIVETSSRFPIGLHSDTDGMNSISIDKLENVPDDMEIFVYDKVLELFHDLRSGDYEFYIEAGEYLERFEITFNNESLSNATNDLPGLDVHFSNASESIVLINPTLINISSLTLYNIIGQSIYSNQKVSSETYSEFKINNLSSGAYIIKVNSTLGTFNKKVFVD